MKRVLLLTLFSAALVLSIAERNLSVAASPQASNPADMQPPVPGSSAGYALIAWSELGMHCIDGKDYSVFSVLPPYNIIHAQLVQKTEPPTIITTGVTAGASRVASGLLCLHAIAIIPGGPMELYSLAFSPSSAAFPVLKSGRLLQLLFRDLLRVHSRYGLQARGVA